MSDAQYNCSPPADQWPAFFQLVILEERKLWNCTPRKERAPASQSTLIYILSMMFCDMEHSNWPVWVSCSDCASSQLRVHVCISKTQEVEKALIFQQQLKHQYIINILLMPIPILNPNHSTVIVTRRKITSVLDKTRIVIIKEIFHCNIDFILAFLVFKTCEAALHFCPWRGITVFSSFPQFEGTLIWAWLQ